MCLAASRNSYILLAFSLLPPKKKKKKKAMISHVPITKRTEKTIIIKVGRSFVEEKKHMVWLITEHMVHTQACLSRTAYAASQLHYHWPPPTKIVLALSSFCL